MIQRQRPGRSVLPDLRCMVGGGAPMPPAMHREVRDDRLLLWDTPGLGDSARLVARVKKEGNPLGWLLHQVWDRTRDRALYSSQEAVRNIQNQAIAPNQ